MRYHRIIQIHFNPVTKIKYDLPIDGNVTIKIFDISGRLINTLVNEYKAAGRFETDFHGENLSSGVYYYRIEKRRIQSGEENDSYKVSV
jgi:flagellar hook assembly protein FlgD